VKKAIITIVVLVFAGAIAVAQDKPATPQTSTDPIIIASGELSIRQSEFENALKTLPPEYQQFAMGPGKKQFAEDYLRMKMLAAEGMKSGLDKDPEVMRSLNLMRENLVANAQLTRLEKTITLTDADLQKVYEANKSEYEQVNARHILVAFKGSPAAQAGKKELTEEEAKAKAEDIKKKLDAGAKFEDLAKSESDDTASGSRGGELGSFSRGQMVEEFGKAAFEAKVGEIVGPVRTQFGYHIIKVESHGSQPLADVKANLERSERQKRLQALLEEMKKKANATFNEAYFNPPAPVKMEAPPTQGGSAEKKAADTKKP
jgi:peptidyl-prolyl cis-trans isomerase C